MLDRRSEPVLANPALRLVLGGGILAAAVWREAAAGAPALTIGIPVAFAWGLSTWLTDKYRHKYPQRYDTYLFASHGKAAVIMAAVLFLLTRFDRFQTYDGAIARAAIGLVVADVLLSLPRRRMAAPAAPVDSGPPPSAPPPEPPVDVHAPALVANVAARPELAAFPGLAEFVATMLKPGDTGLSRVEIASADEIAPVPAGTAMLVQLKSLNTVRRLNRFLMGLPGQLPMGGYFVFRYRPLDDALAAMRESRRGPALWITYGWHFLRHRALPKIPVLEQIYFSKPFSILDAWIYRRTEQNRRVISRAEMWGRMYYWGFEVLDEQTIGGDQWVVTRRFRPAALRQPSFFMVARLTKVGLDGRLMHLHKIRTMYPFSEFVQERLYQDHGLSTTGKFRNDFRLTDYGKVLRKYWLDEVPQIFDWLRGEVKLVGMRATSPHFLGLYPKPLYDLYVRTKPGLIPPIFDASTSGFDDIVRIEFDYLDAYQRRPFMTDTRCLLKTLHDIVIRGVRSK